MYTISLRAPAKINLFLKVLNRRPDGYHAIETLFEKIDLCDGIKLIKSSGGISVHSSKKALPEGKENLAFRAAALMEERLLKRPLGLRIEIEKSIPIGAGLGGGSSDAAAVLIGINRLYEMGLSTKELEELAKNLGADVPFFVSDKTWAVGRERGDSLEGVKTRMRLWHILIIPPFSILSREAYQWVDGKSFGGEWPELNNTLSALSEDDIDRLGKNLHNDLEGIAFERLGGLKELKERLIEYGAKGSAISGSGPALFGIARDKEEVIALKKEAERVVDSKWQVLIVPALSEAMI